MPVMIWLQALRLVLCSLFGRTEFWLRTRPIVEGHERRGSHRWAEPSTHDLLQSSAGSGYKSQEVRRVSRGDGRNQCPAWGTEVDEFLAETL